MPPIVALILCAILVAALLCIEHRRNREVSNVLWVPTLWLLLCGSKPLGRWFESSAVTVAARSYEAGSPLDRFVLSILIIVALLILFRRGIVWSRILRDNFWLILLFLYLGLSILWSDFPGVSLKRWVRLSGAIPIALLVLTERCPLRALESVFRRCAYVLIPFSLLLIKYFPEFGVDYTPWSGDKMWVGVTLQKNSLGTICALSAFFIIWSFHREWQAGTFCKNRSHAFADGLVLVISVFLLRGFKGAYSATSIGILIVGTASLMVLSRVKNHVRHMATVLVFAVAAALLSLQFIDSVRSAVTSAFQRDESFTGRTDIWNAVLDVASQNPLFGVGYGAYWGLADEKIYLTLGVRESHSGYLDVYLELGVAGIVLLLVFLLAYYRKVLRELNYTYEWGMFGVCLLMMTLVHNFTENNLLETSSYFWNILLFLTIVFSEPLFRLPASVNSKEPCPKGRASKFFVSEHSIRCT